jgi:hypothetical protein
MADDRRKPDNPRSPEHHDLTGTGSPRSADDGLPQQGTYSEDRDSQLAQADQRKINRSGSGGSGGPSTPDPTVEGSTGESMSELLSGEGDAEPQAG